jgi:hypothetical protein
MDSAQKIQFERTGLFYRMVTSYMAAICGMLVFRPELGFDQSVRKSRGQTP